MLATPVALGWVAMAWVLAHAAPGTHLPLILGHTWRVCPILIAALAMPAFVAMLWAVRGMAPVRPRLAGAAVGLLAGATGTVAYCLHCPEMAPPFWSTWYLLGMLIPAALGILAGPRRYAGSPQSGPLIGKLSETGSSRWRAGRYSFKLVVPSRNRASPFPTPRHPAASG